MATLIRAQTKRSHAAAGGVSVSGRNPRGRAFQKLESNMSLAKGNMFCDDV